VIERRALRVISGQRRGRAETMGPEIVDPDELQSAQHCRSVPEDRHASVLQHLLDVVRGRGLRPSKAVVVIAQRGDGGEPAPWQVVEHASEPVQLVGPAVGDEVTGQVDEVGTELGGAVQRFLQVGFAHPVSHVQIADVHQGGTQQLPPQPGQGKWPLDELHPVRLHLPGIETEAQRPMSPAVAPAVVRRNPRRVHI
jgi:hypothetical protein